MEKINMEIDKILANKLCHLVYINIMSVMEDCMIKKEAEEHYKDFKDMIEFHKRLCEYLGNMGQHSHLLYKCKEIINRLPDNDYEDFL